MAGAAWGPPATSRLVSVPVDWTPHAVDWTPVALPAWPATHDGSVVGLLGATVEFLRALSAWSTEMAHWRALSETLATYVEANLVFVVTVYMALYITYGDRGPLYTDGRGAGGRRSFRAVASWAADGRALPTVCRVWPSRVRRR